MPFEQSSDSEEEQSQSLPNLQIDEEADADERVKHTYFAEQESLQPHRAKKTLLGLSTLSRTIIDKSLKEHQEKERAAANQTRSGIMSLVGFALPRMMIIILIALGVGWIFLTYQTQLPGIASSTPVNIIVITPTASQEPSPSLTPIIPSTTRPQRPRNTVTPPIGVTNLPSMAATENAEVPLSSDTIRQAGGIMIFIQEGLFTMGSKETATLEHSIYLDTFYIDQQEVTNAQWAACVDDSGCTVPKTTSAFDGSPYYDDADFANYPVIHINWYNAEKYCQWRGSRLPSEAEWEKAARWNPNTDTVTAYPWGDSWLAENLNHCDAECLLDIGNLAGSDGWSQLAPVGSFPAGLSAVGLWDIAGNVSEWVADWFDTDYYETSPDENPLGPAKGILRSVRGGSWRINDPTLLFSANRSRFAPETSSAGIGFRCAISADQVSDE